MSSSSMIRHLFPQAGVPLRLFHKEIEAYLCAEGLFDDEITEDGTVKLPYMKSN